MICQDCGSKLITLGELRDEIARQARDYATKSIRESFGRVPTSGPPA